MSHNDPKGGMEEGFSPDDAKFTVIGTALSRFLLQLDDYRMVWRLSKNRGDRNASMSPRLLGLRRNLSADEQRRAEKAASDLKGDVRNDLKTLIESVPTEEATDRKHYPVAPEQLAVLGLVSGRNEVEERRKQLFRNCGNDPAVVRYALEHLAWSNRDPFGILFGRLLLPSIVASFEELLAALFRLWLTVYPNAFGGADQKESVQEMTSYASVDDIKRLVIDKRVDGFMHEGLRQWEELLKKEVKMSLDEMSRDWPRVQEIFARRNSLIHSGGLVDNTYMKQLPEELDRPTFGTPLTCDAEYIHEAFDLVEQLGTALSIAWVVKLAKQSLFTPSIAIDPVYRALQDERWRDAKKFADLVLGSFESGDDCEILRVNLWMARQQLDEDPDEVAAEMEAWQPPADDARFKFARAALMHDEHECVVIVNDIQKRDASLLSEIAEWPLTKRMREESPFFSRQLTLVLKRQQKTRLSSPSSFRSKRGKTAKSRRRK